MSIKTKTVRGAFWTGTYYALNQILTFCISIILARLLVPEDFGLVAIVMIVIRGLTIFQGLGLNSALIYFQEITDHVKSVAFFIITLTSLCLFIIGFLSAPYIAMFFDNLQVIPILRLLVIIILTEALGIVPATLLDKELKFREQLLPEIVSLLTYGLIAFILAGLGWGVWSIVWGKIIQSVVRTASLWFINPWHLRLVFDATIAKKFIGYGKDISLNSLLIFIFLSVDNLVVGKILGEYILGLYSTAFNWSNLPANLVKSMFGRVLFPSLSKLQYDVNRVRKAYLHALSLIIAVTLPVTIGLYSVSEEVVSVLYTEKWLAMIPILKILCFYGFFRSVGAIVGPVFKASGNQSLMLKVITVQVISTIILILPVTARYGAIGTATLFTISQMITILIDLYLVGQIVGVSTRDYFRSLTPQILGSSIMFLIVKYIKNWITLTLFGLIMLILTGVITYSLTLHLISKGQILKDFLDLFYSIPFTPKRKNQQIN